MACLAVEGDQWGDCGVTENAMQFWAADVEGHFVHGLQAGASGHEFGQWGIDQGEASFHALCDFGEFVGRFIELVEELRGGGRFFEDEIKS